MKPANYSPVYAALYPELAEIARSHGYAMAIHGSMARDFDVFCIPWAEHITTPQDLVDAITQQFHVRQIGEPDQKNHGRIAYTISIGHGECALDLSFAPAIREQSDELERLREVVERCAKVAETVGDPLRDDDYSVGEYLASQAIAAAIRAQEIKP